MLPITMLEINSWLNVVICRSYLIYWYINHIEERTVSLYGFSGVATRENMTKDQARYLFQILEGVQGTLGWQSSDYKALITKHHLLSCKGMYTGMKRYFMNNAGADVWHFSPYNINMITPIITWWRKQQLPKHQNTQKTILCSIKHGAMHQHTIRRIVTIDDTTWKATSPHTLIASWLGSFCTSCSHHFFPSWLSKWAPYMDSLAETSCKCHVGLRRKKT